MELGDRKLWKNMSLQKCWGMFGICFGTMIGIFINQGLYTTWWGSDCFESTSITCDNLWPRANILSAQPSITLRRVYTSTLDELHIFIQQWRPSLHEFAKMSEIQQWIEFLQCNKLEWLWNCCPMMLVLALYCNHTTSRNNLRQKILLRHGLFSHCSYFSS